VAEAAEGAAAMIAGHFGFAAAVKSRAPATPLWALMLATVWLDIVFVPLLLTHVETLQPAPGADRAYGGHLIYADYTHSLVGALALSAVLGLAAAWAWDRRSGLVIAAVAFSHWLWDLLMHRGDMPILPGNAGHFARLGLGLWRWPLPSAGAELALVLIGGALYLGAARRTSLAAGRTTTLANLTGGLVWVFGVLVLALDFTGVLP
jgi:hypothetical protein